MASGKEKDFTILKTRFFVPVSSLGRIMRLFKAIYFMENLSHALLSPVIRNPSVTVYKVFFKVLFPVTAIVSTFYDQQITP
jgi:hypothetical protein